MAEYFTKWRNILQNGRIFYKMTEYFTKWQCDNSITVVLQFKKAVLQFKNGGITTQKRRYYNFKVAAYLNSNTLW